MVDEAERVVEVANGQEPREEQQQTKMTMSANWFIGKSLQMRDPSECKESRAERVTKPPGDWRTASDRDFAQKRIKSRSPSIRLERALWSLSGPLSS